MSEKLKSDSTSNHSIDQGEIHHFLSSRTHKEVAKLDTLALSNSKEAKKYLKEAQANLEFAANTGYTPELRRDFSLISLLGIGFGITNSWYGISGSLIAGISSGGPIIIIYGILIVVAFSSAIAITLSELASAFPNAGGQIYWTMKLAPRKYSSVLTYATGMLNWLGAVFTSASVTMTIGTAVMGMYTLYHPDHVIQRWQVFIVYEVSNLIICIANIWEGPLPTLSSGTLYVSLMSFIIIIITVLSMHKGDFQDARFVFVEFQNETGWSSSAIAFITGLISANWSQSCLDATTHIAEESSRPETDIPKAILATVAIGFVTSFTYSIAMFFSIANLDEIFKSTTGVPIMDIYYQATGSKAAAFGLEFLVVLTAIGCNIGCHTWQARICWSFARDKGLPFSNVWEKIDNGTGTPVYAHLFSNFWVAVIGCIYLGSTSAFNSILVSCVTFLLLSYLIPTVFLIAKRNQIKPGPFWFNKFGIGLICNVMLCVWAIFAFVFYNFPSVMPVTGSNMNYSSAVVGVVLVICVCDWLLRGRREFVSIEEREANIDQLTHTLSNQISNIEVVLSKQ